MGLEALQRIGIILLCLCGLFAIFVAFTIYLLRYRKGKSARWVWFLTPGLCIALFTVICLALGL